MLQGLPAAELARSFGPGSDLVIAPLGRATRPRLKVLSLQPATVSLTPAGLEAPQAP